jgi:hypothetical protein
MLSLLAVALGVTAATVQAAAATPEPQTLRTYQGTTISAFAQDGQLVAWFSRGKQRCNGVHVISLANGLQTALPQQTTRNVTCRWEVGASPVRLALGGSAALWTLQARSPIPFDYLIGAAVADPKERRYQEIAHTLSGSGLWLGGISGDGSTLVYGVTSVDYADEAGCLAGTSPCALKVVGGGVYRVEGRPRLVPGPDRTGAVAVAAAGGAVAYVPTTTIGKQGRPVATAELAIEVVDATTGASISHVRTEGTPLALALSAKVVSTLERTPLGLRVAWYERTSGQPLGSLPVSRKASPELTATDTTIVYRVGRSIRAVDVATSKARTLALAAAVPVGLSLEGARLAWAENLPGSARIRTLTLRP